MVSKEDTIKNLRAEVANLNRCIQQINERPSQTEEQMLDIHESAVLEANLIWQEFVSSQNTIVEKRDGVMRTEIFARIFQGTIYGLINDFRQTVDVPRINK